MRATDNSVLSVRFLGCDLYLGFYTLGVAADVVCGQPWITKREASGKFGYRWGGKIGRICQQQAGLSSYRVDDESKNDVGSRCTQAGRARSQEAQIELSILFRAGCN